MDQQAQDSIDAVAHIAFAGLSAGLHAMRLMASRGLVSPAEVEEYADSLFSHFDHAETETTPAAQHLRKLRASMEHRLAAPLAEVRQYAKARWIGAKDDQTP